MLSSKKQQVKLNLFSCPQIESLPLHITVTINNISIYSIDLFKSQNDGMSNKMNNIHSSVQTMKCVVISDSYHLDI